MKFLKIFILIQMMGYIKNAIKVAKNVFGVEMKKIIIVLNVKEVLELLMILKLLKIIVIKIVHISIILIRRMIIIALKMIHVLKTIN